VVLLAGRPLILGEVAQRADALLMAYLPGSQGGRAIASVLFGEASPGGRLPFSWPRDTVQVPIFYDHLRAEESPTPEYDPLYSFGYGLSYTRFTYSPVTLSKASIKPGEPLTASVTVTNSGARDGEEVVQLYVRDLVGSVTRPVKELKGFDKVALAPGESKPVRFVLTAMDLAYYDPARGAWVAEPGLYDILVGASSRDIRVQATVELTQGLNAETRLDEESAVRAWMQHPAGRAALQQALPPEAFARLAAQPPTSFLWELPLKKLPLLSQGALDESVVRRAVAALRA